jgi:predicted permease
MAMTFSLWKGKQRKEEFVAEIESHLEMAKRDRVGRGESAKQAEHSARKEFGNVALVEQVTRDQWGWIWLEEFWQDLRYGARMVRRNPGFATIAVLTLVLGIGANTAIFSLVNGVLLRPLPFREPERLAAFTIYYPKGVFAILREHSRTMEVIANTDLNEFNLTGRDLPVRLEGTSVSANWFSVLGVQAAMGRTFQDGEDQPGKEDVVILSHALWEQRFGSDQNIIGHSIVLEGVNREVVGVMPADFAFPSPQARLWVPLDMDPRNAGDFYGASYMPLVARLRPGVSLEQARAEQKQLRLQALAEYPWRMPDNTWVNGSVAPMQEVLVGDVRERLLLLLGAVGLLLLIACTNVANLWMARATTRRKEIALRTALGAGRARIARQLVTESVLISVLGGAVGLVAARYGLTVLKTMLPADMPRLTEVTVDMRVLIFAALLSIVTGIVFGLVPAGGTAKFDLTKALKTGGERGGIAGRHRLSGFLVAGEVGVSVILVIAAGLLVKSLWNLSNADTGFRTGHILTARVTPNQSFCAEAGRCQTFYKDLLTRVAAVGGVQNAAVVNGLPLSGNWDTLPVNIEARPVAPGAHVPMFMERVCSPEYLQILGIPLLQGRGLTEADGAASAQRVALISKSTAERYWPGNPAIGEHFRPSWMNEWWTVVGVVGDVREYSMTKNLAEWVDGEFYTAYGPHAIRGTGPEAPPAEVTLVIRTTDGSTEVGSELQGIASSLNGDVPVSQVEMMSGWIEVAVAGTQSTAMLFAIFALLAVALGAVGIYGVISYSVAQRTREIGIRMALGARRDEVLILVMGQGARLALMGVAFGLIGAVLLTRLMASLLYGVGAMDPMTYAGVGVLLMLVALAASYVPARRAMRVDPMVALRYE